MSSLATYRSHVAASVGSTMVERTRVLGLLEESAAQPVVCVQAPGGYGKSTALRQWVATDSRPVVWLSVRPQAPDPVWVVSEMLAEMVAVGVLSEAVTVPLGEEPVTWHLGTLPTVEAAVSQASPFLLVIDDAGSMSGEAWDCLVKTLADSLHSGGQLVLVTRDRLPACVAELRTRGAVRDVRRQDLAFDAVEGGELAGLLSPRMPASAVHEVLEQTQGWPVAVCLALLSARSGRRPASQPTVESGTALLNDYMRTQIVDRLKAEDAEFLTQVSVLTQLDEHTCERVVPGSGALARLRRLAESHHLLEPVDLSREHFRMHPLLAGFLSEELRANDPTRWHAAQTAASQAHEDVGDLDTAVLHARLCGDDARLGRLVWHHAGLLIGRGQDAVLERWLDGVDDARLAAQGELALTAAWLAVKNGDRARMGRFHLAASAALRSGTPGRAADLALLRATIETDSVSELCEAATVAVDGLDPDDPWLTLAHFLVGVSRVLLGQGEQGEVCLRRGYHIAVAYDLPAMRCRCLAALAECALAKGDQLRALSLIRESRELMVTHPLDLQATTAPAFVTSAWGYVLEGRLVDARREALLALRLTSMMRVVPSWSTTFGSLALARVFIALNDQVRAAGLLAEAEVAYSPAVRSDRGDEMFVQIRQRLAELSPSSSGVEALTSAELRILQYLPTHLSFPQIADELFVSRHTVKTQALAVYRKLGAHNRDEAIHRARDQGLLPRR